MRYTFMGWQAWRWALVREPVTIWRHPAAGRRNYNGWGLRCLVWGPEVRWSVRIMFWQVSRLAPCGCGR